MPLLQRSAGSEEDLILSGTVYRKEIKETYQLLYLKKIQLRGKDSPGQYINCSIKSCILYDKTFKDIPLGREIRSKGTVKLFEEAGNPGNFEQDFYYRKQGIRFQFQAKELALTAKKQTPEGRVLTVLMNVREAWQEILAEGAGKENGAVLSAVLTGEKSEMSRETKELYQKNGIGHILAISGLHVSFIGLGLYRSASEGGMFIYRVRCDRHDNTCTVYGDDGKLGIGCACGADARDADRGRYCRENI